MKKFISGFVLGGLIFGTIAAVAAPAATPSVTLKGVQFDLQDVLVDGKPVTKQAKNMPFTFNGYSYIPSYMLADLGYTASRTPDKKTVILKSSGQAYYVVDKNYQTDDKNVISLNTNTTTFLSNIDIQYKSKNSLKDSANNYYDNYIYAQMMNTENDKSYFGFTVPLDEKFRSFNAKGYLFQDKTSGPFRGEVQVSAYIVNNNNEETLFKTWTWSKLDSIGEMTIPLRYAKSLRFKITNMGEGQVEFAMLQPVFIK